MDWRYYRRLCNFVTEENSPTSENFFIYIFSFHFFPFFFFVFIGFLFVAEEIPFVCVSSLMSSKIFADEYFLEDFSCKVKRKRKMKEFIIWWK